ncbi:MAG: hypothetical protein LUQ26_01800 [Methylococcaceae bacterium]|nr:hypothetical protein [Methylococcaceae bacterium]
MSQHPHRDIIHKLADNMDIKVECQFEKWWHKSNLELVVKDYRGECIFQIVDEYHEYPEG